eukprot:SAG11_NODE_8818_length_973_cov_1.415332_1_plen_160_part_00
MYDYITGGSSSLQLAEAQREATQDFLRTSANTALVRLGAATLSAAVRKLAADSCGLGRSASTSRCFASSASTSTSTPSPARQVRMKQCKVRRGPTREHRPRRSASDGRMLTRGAARLESPRGAGAERAQSPARSDGGESGGMELQVSPTPPLAPRWRQL